MAKFAGRRGRGEAGEVGGQDAVVQAGEEHSGVQAGVGDAVAVGSGHALDEAMGAESAQVVGYLPGADIGQAAEFGGEAAQVAVGEAAGLEPEYQ
jgi:hypothetical protein